MNLGLLIDHQFHPYGCANESKEDDDEKQNKSRVLLYSRRLLGLALRTHGTFGGLRRSRVRGTFFGL